MCLFLKNNEEVFFKIVLKNGIKRDTGSFPHEILISQKLC